MPALRSRGGEASPSQQKQRSLRSQAPPRSSQAGARTTRAAAAASTSSAGPSTSRKRTRKQSSEGEDEESGNSNGEATPPPPRRPTAKRTGGPPGITAARRRPFYAAARHATAATDTDEDGDDKSPSPTPPRATRRSSGRLSGTNATPASSRTTRSRARPRTNDNAAATRSRISRRTNVKYDDSEEEDELKELDVDDEEEDEEDGPSTSMRTLRRSTRGGDTRQSRAGKTKLNAPSRTLRGTRSAQELSEEDDSQSDDDKDDDDEPVTQRTMRSNNGKARRASMRPSPPAVTRRGLRASRPRLSTFSIIPTPPKRLALDGEDEGDDEDEDDRLVASTTNGVRKPPARRNVQRVRYRLDRSEEEEERGVGSSDDNEMTSDEDALQRRRQSQTTRSTRNRQTALRTESRRAHTSSASSSSSSSEVEVIATARKVASRQPARKADKAQPRSQPARTRQRRERLNILDTAADEELDENSSSETSEGLSESLNGKRSKATQSRARRMLDRIEMSDEDSSSDASSSSGSSTSDSDEIESSQSEEEQEEVDPAEPVDIDDSELQPFSSISLPTMPADEDAEFVDMVSEFAGSMSEPESEQRFTSRGRRVHKRRRLGVESDEERTRRKQRASIVAISSDSEDVTAISDDDGRYALSEDKIDDATQHHFDTCYSCGDRPGWLQFTALKQMRSRLRKQQMKQERRNRKKRRRMRRGDGSRSYRAGGRYDEGAFEDLHALGVAQSALHDRFQDIKTKAAWLRCSTCSASIHTGCLAETDPARLVREINRDATAVHRVLNLEGPPPKTRTELQPSDVVEGLQCSLCAEADWMCMICAGKCVQKPSRIPSSEPMVTAFRCKRCSRAAHYTCLEGVTGEESTQEAALSRQKAGWRCLDCESWGDVDVILAWRPLRNPAEPDGTPEPKESWQKLHKVSEDLKREYLVKFKHTSFKETQWVPHLWLRSVAMINLRHFLSHGSRLELDPSATASSKKKEDEEQTATVQELEQQRKQRRRSKRLQLALTVSRETGEVMRGPPAPESDAQERIPKTWVTPDRILDVYLSVSAVSAADLLDPAECEMFHRRPRKITKIGQGAGISARKDQLEQSTEHIHISKVNQDVLEGLSEGRMFDLLQDAKVLIKWEDLEYEQSTWEESVSPVSYGERWRSFVSAFRRYLHSRKVYVKQMTSQDLATLDRQRSRSRFESIESQPTYIKGGKMLDFQIEGLNWLRYSWHVRQPGILADEMGLGKTVQVIAFIASLHHQFGGLAPYLVVVPNSVVTNWVREFEHWCPHLRVVPYFGGRESRGVIERFEMFHLESIKGRQDLRAEVIVCSDTVARLDPAPFRRVQQWQVLVVDEGTNLKSGSSILIYKRLAALNAAHRLIMTGTPLNNNIGELFNLLNWLKPDAEWKDLKSLRAKYETLTPELIAELQPLLRPYILRRLKKDVVNLPPRSEILIPVSLTPLQKRVYKDVLERNVEDIQTLTDLRGKRQQKYHIGNLLNVLMQLRKVCQHPYLVAPTLENFEGANINWKLEAQRLVDASAKLKLLQKMLPILKDRGHRVLIFSQFVIYLDIVESFLLNEGNYKYQRLDGSIGNRQRQQGISAFNAPGSDLFCYLLSTRAGGVGINLASADTVIILDQDFNPHLDMQAIARAHRIGQKKKVIVFTLVTQDTAEEKIVTMARKKLALDHIIHNMDDEENRIESLQDVLRYGARALFQARGTEASRKDIRFTDADVEKLVTDCENGEDVTQQGGGATSLLSFAKVWERDEADEAEEPSDPTADMAEEGFWASLLERTRAQQEARQEAEEQIVGRGGQRKAKLQAMGLAPANFPGLRVGDDESEDEAEVEQSAQLQGQSQGAQEPTFDSTFDDGPDFTIETNNGTMSSSGTSDEGTPERDGITPPASAAPAPPIKRGRGRPRKNPLPPEQPPTLLDLAFSNTSRRLKVPKPPKEPKPRGRPRKQKVPAQPGAQPSMNSGSGSEPVETNIYNRIAEVTDPAVAREMAFTNFPGRPELAMALFRAWSDIIQKRTGTNPMAKRHNVDAAAARTAAQAASMSALPPVARLADPESGGGQLTTPAKRRRGRPKKNQAPPAASVAGTQPSGDSASSLPRPRPRPSVQAATGDAPTAPSHPPGPASAVGSEQPSTSTATASSSSLDSSKYMHSRRSVTELKKMLRDLPEDFVEQVRARHIAKGPPAPLLVHAGRSQLTTQHMAYFSLRVLRSITGVHPLFHDAFTLVQSEQVPPTLRAQPFEGAEMLSTPIITERLVETAYYFFAQLWAVEGGAPPTTATGHPSAAPPAAKKAAPKKPRQSKAAKAAQAQTASSTRTSSQQQQESNVPQPQANQFAAAVTSRAGPISAPSPMTVDSVLNHGGENVGRYGQQQYQQHDQRNERRPAVEAGHSNSYLYHGGPSTPGAAGFGHLQAAQSYGSNAWASGGDNGAASSMGPPSSQRRGRHTSSAQAAGQAFSSPASWSGSASRPSGNASSSNNFSNFSQTASDASSMQLDHTTAQADSSSSNDQQLALYWLESIDSLNLAGLSKAARMWLIHPTGHQRDVMGAEINSRLATELDRRRRLGQGVPDFFR
ncbi:hypothetical protein BDZ90DRAFT_260877 [Jaminaea rosea]|uniref:Uncharacterized protein n=1 Tax=Jaminaea rosea TaxID=1569628 RepID=A0A316UPK1_9BASI|nr:hypothetical protein BDZ90DRAFT_260877 [Jaminaea rosea]PWN27219.1 hypothetical protein BDZ90DRAFT_260877 [Jaminaea rosea]